MTASLTGCGGSANRPTGITISGPASATVDPSNSASFTATVAGGPTGAGVSWSLIGCTATSCGTLTNSTATGVTYTAPATVTTAFTVTLTASSTTDANVTAGTMLSVPVNPAITTTTLPGATYDTAYTATLAGTGGISPYTWSVSLGTLPAGLALSSTGTLSGTPTAAGAVSFTVQLADSGSPALTTTAAYTITTLYAPLSVTTKSLPNGVESAAYSAQLTATGGSGTGYTWSATGTALSAVGLSLSSTGAITGTPNADETSAPLTVQVTDSAGNTATANITLSVVTVTFLGQVLAGAAPVSGATIQLYAAGATGNASAAIPMLTQSVTTSSIGIFQLNGSYTCGQSSTGASIPNTAQLYLVATGGIASTTSSASNSALTMVTAVGPCSTLAATSQLTLNEVTTAAAAWALGSFASSAANIGASSTNTLGLTNAFLDAALLANPNTGANATLPTNLTVETGKLNALADALNSCTAGDDSTCTALFTAATPTNGTAPTDTFTAALNITHHPGENVAAVYAAISANGPTTPPFATAPLAQSPNDWTMSLTVTGGGLSSPTALGIDTQNNIWVANQDSPVSAFNAQGTPLVADGYGPGVIAQTYGLAVDPSNNIWVTNANGGSLNGSVTEFYGVTSANTLGTSSTYTDGSLDVPYAIAADSNGAIYIANSGDSSATIYSSTGAYLAGPLGNSSLNLFPNAIAVDPSHDFWLSGATNVVRISSTGTLLANVTCCGESFGMATDAAGDLWVADYGAPGAVAEITTNGSGVSSAALTGLSTGGINHPAMVAVDAAQNVWISNYYGASITELAGSSNTLAPGTAISPSTGVYGIGGYGLDASLGGPNTLIPDRSGNLWVSDEGGPEAITMFFGLAAPTATPLLPVPTAP
ncbi:MAG: NHL repeat-containing protein [Acidobacteriaceae bacterium]